ncbi:hypothetical protein OH768_26640 [Streptomyces sp. NBC_01622]|uniref:hypothetical protein n=1 Tax=Streptomyces sp. NBC_01622 TaxID=2975903 RepID=UPI003866EE23|nr:hypothetical protein OH768_26640 [Streptomyces sp. NBC_01622]
MPGQPPAVVEPPPRDGHQEHDLDRTAVLFPQHMVQALFEGGCGVAITQDERVPRP